MNNELNIYDRVAADLQKSQEVEVTFKDILAQEAVSLTQVLNVMLEHGFVPHDLLKSQEVFLGLVPIMDAEENELL